MDLPNINEFLNCSIGMVIGFNLIKFLKNCGKDDDG